MDRSIFEIHIELERISPAIYRRVQVPANTQIAQLHEIIQIIYAWKNTHLHQFRCHGTYYVPTEPEEGEPNQKGYTDLQIGEILPEIGAVAKYLYDFGDGWVHSIKLVEIKTDALLLRSVCIAAQGKAPKEDSGGPLMYMDQLKKKTAWGKPPGPIQIPVGPINKRLSRLDFT